MADGERSRDERWVSGLLQEEAERHEPDRRRVLARIWSQVEAPAGTGASGPRRPRAGRPAGWVVPAAMAAGSVVVVAAVTLLGVRPGAGPAAVSPTEPVQVLSATPDPSPSLPGAIGSAVPAPSGAPPAPSSPGPAPSTGSGARARGSVRVAVSPAQAGQVVRLPGTADRDWVVAGSSPDGVTVRSRDGGQRIGGPHLTGNPIWAVTDGPFLVSWAGGMPEQDEPGEQTWLSVHGPAGGPVTGMRISVPAGAGPGTLVLYAGATGAGGHLRATVAGAAAEADLPAGSAAAGYVVTLRFTVHGGPASLDVDLISGSGGAVCLAAASLR